MIATKKYIKKLRENFIRISAEAEKKILEELGTEPDDYEYTEQDIWEHCRKIIDANPPRVDIPDFLKSETEKAGF